MKSTRKFNEDNERMKRSYLRYLRNAKGLSENSVNKASDAILRWEKATDFKPFSKLNGDDVLQFKEHLSRSATGKTGKPMVAASRVNIQVCVRSFVHWLADQQVTGPKSRTALQITSARCKRTCGSLRPPGSNRLRRLSRQTTPFA
jgi:integrase/recombinase XerD